MSFYPSHNNSMNGRNERRANWKADLRQTVIENLTAAIIAKFEKYGQKAVDAGLVTRDGNTFKVKSGKHRHYPVYKIRNSFVCECRDREKYGDCAHQHAARIFAAENA